MPSRGAGFSLIELVVAMAIMGILIAMGMPAFATYLANTKVRANAESLISGLQLARTEALRRNNAVEFSLSGTSWTIQTIDGTYIDGKQGAESGGAKVTIASADPSITFTNLGGAAPASTFNLSYDGDSCAADGGPIRCLRIDVSIGGRIRMCDPAATAANDTRGC